MLEDAPCADDPHPATDDRSMESYVAWQGKMLQATCLGLVVMSYMTAVSKIRDQERDGKSADSVMVPSLTDDVRFCTGLIICNALPYLASSVSSRGLEPWNGMALSLGLLTVQRVSQIMGLGRFDQDQWQIGGGWVILTRWDVAGSSLALGHFAGGFLCGLLHLKKSFHNKFAAFCGAMRCVPALVLYYYSGDSEILERMLIIFVVPMVSSFWLARGIYMLILYLRHAKSKELEILRERCKQLEAARLQALQQAHLERMATMRNLPRRQLMVPTFQTEDNFQAEDGEGVVHGGTLFAGLACIAAPGHPIPARGPGRQASVLAGMPAAPAGCEPRGGRSRLHHGLHAASEAVGNSSPITSFSSLSSAPTTVARPLVSPETMHSEAREVAESLSSDEPRSESDSKEIVEVDLA